jgi:hypothetical protein
MICAEYSSMPKKRKRTTADTHRARTRRRTDDDEPDSDSRQEDEDHQDDDDEPDVDDDERDEKLTDSNENEDEDPDTNDENSLKESDEDESKGVADSSTVSTNENESNQRDLPLDSPLESLPLSSVNLSMRPPLVPSSDLPLNTSSSATNMDDKSALLPTQHVEPSAYPLVEQDQVLLDIWGVVVEGNVLSVGRNASIQVARTELSSILYPWRRMESSVDDGKADFVITEEYVTFKQPRHCDSVISVCQIREGKRMYASRLSSLGFRDVWLNYGDKIQIIMQGSSSLASGEVEDYKCDRSCPCQRTRPKPCPCCPYPSTIAYVVQQAATEVRIQYQKDKGADEVCQEWIPRNSLRCWRRLAKGTDPNHQSIHGWTFLNAMDAPIVPIVPSKESFKTS